MISPRMLTRIRAEVMRQLLHAFHMLAGACSQLASRAMALEILARWPRRAIRAMQGSAREQRPRGSELARCCSYSLKAALSGLRPQQANPRFLH